MVPARERGFTLLEVLVAFAIAAPALILLLGQGVSSVSTGQTSALYQEAISRAKSRLATLSGEALQAGERDGDDGAGFRWRTRVVPLATTRLGNATGPTGGGVQGATGATLYDVTVELSWPGHLSTRGLTLSSRRLGPASAAGP